MISIQTRTAELAGTNYEIGYQLGSITAGIPPLKAAHTQAMPGFSREKTEEAKKLFDQWCPGLTEELTGFADALHVSSEQVFYYGMTYLIPQCSHIALLPGSTAEGKPLLARNYEFNHNMEDFCLVKTSAKGKYTHMGTSVLQFGRDDGFNEHGLAVTMSSCGFPVGPMSYMRAPKLRGLQFWAVIRALLENCKDVQEALSYLKEIPIAYNVNMILLDRAGNAALVETLDGRYAVKQIDGASKEQALWATNHPVLPELVPYEPKALVHSACRCEWIGQQVKSTAKFSKEQLKNMLLSKYPDGLCCHYYEEYFGTTKSMVISPADGTVELCWGGREQNGWNTYDIMEPLGSTMREIGITPKHADPKIYKEQPIK
ncbi:MAG: C45 family peptidase [Christensenella sp.]|uniref:C45 family peptidase n=1 Tax=Christensenella sp. TaxID=1935934 RepID=UPI002B1EE1BD|nr:C45 family peptidase [Christensenella sp.]MEA5004757.1 C45 family peptidase [Christensenella sp.]